MASILWNRSSTSLLSGFLCFWHGVAHRADSCTGGPARQQEEIHTPVASNDGIAPENEKETACPSQKNETSISSLWSNHNSCISWSVILRGYGNSLPFGRGECGGGASSKTFLKSKHIGLCTKPKHKVARKWDFLYEFRGMEYRGVFDGKNPGSRQCPNCFRSRLITLQLQGPEFLYTRISGPPVLVWHGGADASSS